mgnify:CR=1 FL=1
MPRVMERAPIGVATTDVVRDGRSRSFPLTPAVLFRKLMFHPDSARATPGICIRAQATALCAALDFALRTRTNF